MMGFLGLVFFGLSLVAAVIVIAACIMSSEINKGE